VIQNGKVKLLKHLKVLWLCVLKYFYTIFRKELNEMKKWFIKVLPLTMVVFLLIVFISPSLAFGDSMNMHDYSKTPSGFVMMYYNSILSREAASSEVNEWVMRLGGGTATGYSLVWDAVFGEENKQMVASASNDDFIKWLYMVI